MALIWWAAASAALAFSGNSVWEVLHLNRLVGRLRRVGGGPAPGAAGSGASTQASPRVTAVVPARNEERRLEVALGSLLSQDYPDLQVVLVNDRSSDRTGAIMDRLAAGRENVQVLHVDRLPPGWVGKNHALYLGARQATGQWLLFTDADVCFDPTAVRRAVTYAERAGLDHLAVVPGYAVRGYWLQAWCAFAAVGFAVYLSPRRANNPRSRAGFGIGAFNLIRADAYAALGTHRAIALRPDDDVRLGRRVKRLGMRQQVLVEPDLVQVEWYTSLSEAIRGLEKNVFAVLNYNLGAAVAACLLGVTLYIYPLVGLLWNGRQGHAVTAAVCAVTIALQFAVVMLSARRVVCYASRRPWRSLALALSYPVTAFLYTYTVARSAWRVLTQGGVTWRDTFYPLEALRRQSG